MRYADIADTNANRFRLPPSHPILAEITIDPVHWHDLQRLDANDPTIHIVGHDIPQNGTDGRPCGLRLPRSPRSSGKWLAGADGCQTTTGIGSMMEEVAACCPLSL